MTFFLTAIYFVPPRTVLKFRLKDISHKSLNLCTNEDIQRESECINQTTQVICSSNCLQESTTFLAVTLSTNFSFQQHKICILTNVTGWKNSTCDISCNEDVDNHNNCVYKSFTFWGFVIFMFIGTTAFNVINSITDAICFDIIGDEGDYGKQKLWSTLGFGVSALISGYFVDQVSQSSLNYSPAFITMLICCAIDIIFCVKLQLPVIEAPKNLLQNFKELLKDWSVVTFLAFAVCAGILDRTLLERFGHVSCFTMCFFSYALRIGLISLAASPWWIILSEFFLNGPSYAMAYATIAAYANDLAPPGASATMQGIAAGMDDGLGYAIGSILVGLLFKYIGAQFTFITHELLHRTVLHHRKTNKNVQNVEYKTSDQANKLMP
ncbi:MFS 1 and/or Nuc H symport domain containing protein [Asbolus verrucosus]|uniref:MFS 1 and/or Nuc H symport domain containing protein n=1 Tax=Asbolus verrucosus TaxID=1661398 RepID=A0A482WD72_ASBVE|nr:MFS 1 and/or Nuc H symport domain containing protein [Asbolus verrucosus]